MKRDKSLDIAKGIAIILMMYGHLRYHYANMDTIYSWIYSFHMPLFIYISGLLTNVKKEKNYLQLWQKIKRILVPYAIWNVVGYYINHVLQLDKRNVPQFIHGLLIGDNLNSNLPTWYLLSFCWITLFAFFILPLLDTVKKLIAADIVAILLVMCLPMVLNTQDFFRLKGFVALLPFFITGYLLKKINFQLPWWLIPLLLYVGFKLGRVNAVQSWRYITVGIGDVCVPYLYLLSAICTTLALVEICKYLSRVPVFEVFGVFGKHTLVILCTHWLLGNILATYMVNVR